MSCLDDELPRKVKDVYVNKYKELFLEKLDI
jgi:hypothetical protein